MDWKVVKLHIQLLVLEVGRVESDSTLDNRDKQVLEEAEREDHGLVLPPSAHLLLHADSALIRFIFHLVGCVQNLGLAYTYQWGQPKRVFDPVLKVVVDK